MPEVTGLLMAAALRPADVLGDHGRAARRSHSLPFAPPGLTSALPELCTLLVRAQYLCGKTQYLSGKRRTASGLIRRGGRRDGAGTNYRGAVAAAKTGPRPHIRQGGCG
jgi:hypothetical protein